MEIRSEIGSLYRNQVIKVVVMGNSYVEKHRLENEEEHGDYLDFVCEEIRDNPVFGGGDGLLDWRYNEDDLIKLHSWLDWEWEVSESGKKVIYVPFY